MYLFVFLSLIIFKFLFYSNSYFWLIHNLPSCSMVYLYLYWDLCSFVLICIFLLHILHVFVFAGYAPAKISFSTFAPSKSTKCSHMLRLDALLSLYRQFLRAKNLICAYQWCAGQVSQSSSSIDSHFLGILNFKANFDFVSCLLRSLYFSSWLVTWSFGEWLGNYFDYVILTCYSWSQG